METEEKPGKGSGLEIIELARRWISYPEEIRKQIHDWESLDAIAHEELGSPSEECNPVETHERKPAIIPFGMRFGYRKFSIKPKNIKAETIHAVEEI